MTKEFPYFSYLKLYSSVVTSCTKKMKLYTVYYTVYLIIEDLKKGVS